MLDALAGLGWGDYGTWYLPQVFRSILLRLLPRLAPHQGTE